MCWWLMQHSSLWSWSVRWRSIGRRWRRFSWHVSGASESQEDDSRRPCRYKRLPPPGTMSPVAMMGASTVPSRATCTCTCRIVGRSSLLLCVPKFSAAETTLLPLIHKIMSLYVVRLKLCKSEVDLRPTSLFTKRPVTSSRLHVAEARAST